MTPLRCSSQCAPPSIVRTMAPPSPTAVPVFASGASESHAMHAARARLDDALAKKGLSFGSAVYVRIFKEEAELEVWLQTAAMREAGVSLFVAEHDKPNDVARFARRARETVASWT